jgi:hypothetical protein
VLQVSAVQLTLLGPRPSPGLKLQPDLKLDGNGGTRRLRTRDRNRTKPRCRCEDGCWQCRLATMRAMNELYSKQVGEARFQGPKPFKQREMHGFLATGQCPSFMSFSLYKPAPNQRLQRPCQPPSARGSRDARSASSILLLPTMTSKIPSGITHFCLTTSQMDRSYRERLNVTCCAFQGSRLMRLKSRRTLG